MSGYVRNLPDGSVEAVFEGEPAAVRALVTWCRKGPAYARVDGVHVNLTESAAPAASGFTVRA